MAKGGGEGEEEYGGGYSSYSPPSYTPSYAPPPEPAYTAPEAPAPAPPPAYNYANLPSASGAEFSYLNPGGGELAPGSSSIPSYGGGTGGPSGGFVDPGNSGNYGPGPGGFAPGEVNGGTSSLPGVGEGGGAAPSAPPISFGGVQSFSGVPSPSGGSFSMPAGGFGQSVIDDSGMTPLDNFSRGGGGAGNLTSFVPGGGINIPSEFPDPTSSASTANSGGVAGGSNTFDPFSTRDPNKSQERVPSGGAFAAQPGETALPPNSQPTSGQMPLAPGFTPTNVASVPLNDLATAATPPAGGIPSAALETPTRGAPAAESYPGQNATASNKSSESSGGAGEKGGGSAIDKLMASLGKNAVGAAIAGAAGLFNISQANKNANTPNVGGLTSTIPQVQSVIDRVNADAAAIASQAQPLRDTGTGIINSTKPLNEQSQRLMSYVATGTLPPEYMTQIQEGSKAAKAAAISNAAARGQNVAPGPRGDYSGNTSLQQQLASIDRQSIVLASTLANQLYDAGVKGIGAANQTISAGTGVVNAGNSTQQNATALTQVGLTGIGLQQDVYKKLIDLDTARSKRVGDAIANFANALGGGGGGGTTIKIGGNNPA